MHLADENGKCVYCGGPGLAATECPATVGIPPMAAVAATGGPGTRLKNMLRKWLGFEADVACGCSSMAAKMDVMGAAWCVSDAGMSEILSVMRGEHAKRKAEGRTVLPWSDFVSRRLVMLACRE